MFFDTQKYVRSDIVCNTLYIEIRDKSLKNLLQTK